VADCGLSNMDDTGDLDTNTEGGGDGPRVGSVAAAVAILRYLALHPEGAGVVPLARSLGLSPSSCFNVVRTLASEHFVEFDPRTKIYSLGIGAHVIGRAALDPRGAFQAVKPRLEAVADKFGVTVALLGLRRNDQFVIIGFCDSASATTKIHLTIGQRLPLLTGAVGRCAAVAFALDDASLERTLTKVKWAARPQLSEYKASLDFYRSRGWAIDSDNFLMGVTTIASSVFDQKGRLQFCVSCTMFSSHHPDVEIGAIGDAVAREARWLSSHLFPSLPAAMDGARKTGRARPSTAKGRKVAPS